MENWEDIYRHEPCAAMLLQIDDDEIVYCEHYCRQEPPQHMFELDSSRINYDDYYTCAPCRTGRCPT